MKPVGATAASARLVETRKCLLDTTAMSCTMLASEPLDTQAHTARELDLGGPQAA